MWPKMTTSSAVFKYFFTLTMIHTSVWGVRFRDSRSSVSHPSHHELKNANYSTAESIFTFWGEWGPCSSTCGMGISMRVRVCKHSSLNTNANSVPLCHGETVQKKICRLKECPPGSLDFRSLQCSQYNKKPIGGFVGRKWVSANPGANPCELRCKSEADQIYGFGKVEDGTSCREGDDLGMCVDGRCLMIGCDERLGSDNKIDKCGICGGRNTSCIHYKDVFYGQPSIKPGKESVSEYQDIVVLPIGSRNIEIRQPIGGNYIAMRDRNAGVIFHGEEFLTKFRGDQILGGTYIRYERVNNKTEILKAPGPTTLQLYVLVLLQDRNPGIHYEYWLPLEQSQPKRSYVSLPSSTASTAVVPSPFPTVTTTNSFSVRQNSRQEFNSKIHKTLTFSTPKTTVKPALFPVYKENPHIRPDLSHNVHLIGKNGKTLNASTPPLIKYGPKRRMIFSRKQSLLFSDASSSTEIDTSKTPTVTTTITTTFSPEFINRPLPIYHSKFYRTIRPIFNYYETFRNQSYSEPRRLYQRPENLPLQTQRDSSSSDDDSILKKKRTKENTDDFKTSVGKSRHPQGLNGKSVKQPTVNTLDSKQSNTNSRWVYTFDGANKKEESAINLNEKWRYAPATVSVAVLPLPSRKNDTKSKKEKKRGGIKYQTSPTARGPCGPCHKVRDQTKHFCNSEFVIRALVIGYEFLHGETRYELEILQSFKNTFALLPREYVWSPDTCRCPKLRTGKEYVLMGRSDNAYRRNESRLIVDKTCFVRTYNTKYARRLHRLRRIQAKKCAKVS